MEKNYVSDNGVMLPVNEYTEIIAVDKQAESTLVEMSGSPRVHKLLSDAAKFGSTTDVTAAALQIGLSVPPAMQFGMAQMRYRSHVYRLLKANKVNDDGSLKDDNGEVLRAADALEMLNPLAVTSAVAERERKKLKAKKSEPAAQTGDGFFEDPA